MSPDPELAIGRLLLQRTGEYDSRAVYIQLLSKQNIQASEDTLVELQERAKNFLDSKKEVLLILGDSGAGKSTFGLRLENELWSEYKQGGSIPLFIDLKAIDTLDKDMIHQHLDELDLFTDEQIEGMRQSRKFVLICDGYDEYHKWTNLHTKNKLNGPRQWQAKMIISCRTQYLGPNYRNYFEPEMPSTANPNFSHSSDLFEEAVIVPFRSTQIQEYVELFTQTPKSMEYLGRELRWNTEQYMERLKSIMHLMELAKNPFMLKMILDVLPSITKTTKKMTRVDLYDRFVELHFKSEQQRLSKQQYSGKMDNEMLSAFSALKDDELVDLGLDFSKQLSLNIFKEQKGANSVTYSVIRDSGSWKNEFFGSDVRAKLLRQSAQLVCRENKEDPHLLIRHRIRPSRKRSSYEFSHRSMLEYFYSCLIFDPRGNVPQLDLAACLDSTESPSPVVEHPLGQLNIVSESSIILFLAERVQQNEELRDLLHTILQLSKTEEETSQAATNAMTILVRARVRFNGADLKGIRVSGADLSCGDFDSAQLQGADLRNTILRNVWLHQADLSNSRMEGVMFGEYPYIQTEGSVTLCRFSPDGKELIFSFYDDYNDDIVEVYDAATWNRIALFGPTNVTSVAYPPSGHLIVSGSHYGSVNLWDYHTGELAFSMIGHTKGVTSVAYSPTGCQIASSSMDKTVRLWEAQAGALELTLSGHTDAVSVVAYSPRGHQLASGSRDSTVRLWDLQTGELIRTLSGHTDNVPCLEFSPSGHQVTSGSWDRTVRVWDVQTGSLVFILSGHTAWITSVAYSPNGQQIASGSLDSTMRLWDAQTGSLVQSLAGHNSGISSVAYSPNGLHIATGGTDQAVRLWDSDPGSSQHSFDGHVKTVCSVAYSPSGHQVASGSLDHTVRLWDAQTGALDSTWSDQNNQVTSVAYSPSGHQIAVVVDKTVQFLDAQTGLRSFTLEGNSTVVTSVAYSPDGQQIVSGGMDKTIRLWDPHTGILIHTLSGHTSHVNSVAYSPCGLQVASGSEDKTVRLWNVQTRAIISTLSGHTEYVNTVTYSPSGHRIASGSDDWTVRLWDPLTGASVLTLSGHTLDVSSVAFSPDGQLFASGSRDSTIRLWDQESGQCLLSFDGSRESVLSIAWKDASDGLFLVAGGFATSVRTWKVIDNEQELRVCLHWKSAPDRLVLSKASIQGVQGLSDMNLRLLLQQQVVGQPNTSDSIVALK